VAGTEGKEAGGVGGAVGVCGDVGLEEIGPGLICELGPGVGPCELGPYEVWELGPYEVGPCEFAPNELGPAELRA